MPDQIVGPSRVAIAGHFLRTVVVQRDAIHEHTLVAVLHPEDRALLESIEAKLDRLLAGQPKGK